MKKFFKTLFVNLTLILIILFIAEFLCVFIDYKELKQNNIFEPNYNFKNYLQFTYNYKKQFLNKLVYMCEDEFRKPALTQSPKEPLILMGCSLTYGWRLKNEECLHTLLSQQTGRSVYNLGLGGACPREMLYLLRHEEMLNNLTNKVIAEYVIYTYIPDQGQRIFSDRRLPSPYFQNINNSCLEYTEKNKIIHSSFFIRFIKNKFYKLYKHFNKEKNFETLCLYFREINKEVQQKFGANLVILVYDDKEKYNWEILEEDNITILKASEITNTNLNSTEYKIPNDPHPNAKAWEIITPKLVKSLKL